MSRGRRATTIGSQGFPRVSGDEPAAYLDADPWTGFSPRERG